MPQSRCYVRLLLCLGILTLMGFISTGCAKKEIASDPSVSLLPGELLPDDVRRTALTQQEQELEIQKRRRIEEERLMEEQRLAEERRLAEEARLRQEQLQKADWGPFSAEHIYFEFDSALLSAESQEKLRAKARWLHDHPGVSVMIEGHTDERGTIAYNLALGERRAESVKSFLMGLGIAPGRMFTISYGKEKPVDNRSVEEAWALNRRAQFVVIR